MYRSEIDDCITFANVDHFSKCGETIIGTRINKANLQSLESN